MYYERLIDKLNDNLYMQAKDVIFIDTKDPFLSRKWLNANSIDYIHKRKAELLHFWLNKLKTLHLLNPLFYFWKYNRILSR